MKRLYDRILALLAPKRVEEVPAAPVVRFYSTPNFFRYTYTDGTSDSYHLCHDESWRGIAQLPMELYALLMEEDRPFVLRVRRDLDGREHEVDLAIGPDYYHYVWTQFEKIRKRYSDMFTLAMTLATTRK